MKKYAIVCGSRTGSTYLCDLLIGTRRCGFPQEFFNIDLRKKYSSELNSSSNYVSFEFKDKLLKKYSTENHVFGVKVVGIPQFSKFILSGMNIDHWIWLQREDEILQAISRYIAWKTNAWHHKKPLPEYSYKDIKWCLEEIQQENERFAAFLEDKDPLILCYEYDLCEMPEQTVMCVLNRMNISMDDLPPIKVVKQTIDPINLTWKKKFLEDEKIRT